MPDTLGSKAGRAVDAIIEELRGRKGIDHCIEEIEQDVEVFDELKEKMSQLIMREFDA